MQSSSILRLPRRRRASVVVPAFSAGAWLLLLSFAAYLLAGIYLVFMRHVVAADALSRVASGYFALYSRDPHLAAIGFVRNPLPSLLVLPLLPFKAVFPALTQLGFAANIVSALFMSATVYQLYATFRDAGMNRGFRLVLAGIFALQPAIIYAAASGSEEAILLFFITSAVRGLALWLGTGELYALVLSGLALGSAYLVGPEAIPAAAGAATVVSVMTFRRQKAERISFALCNVVVLLAPVGLALLSWLAAAWVITGDPFQQLSSAYATASELNALHLAGFDLAGFGSRAVQSLTLLGVTAGGLAIGLPLSILGLRRRRDPQLVAALALLAPVVLAMLALQAAGVVLVSLDGLLLAVPLMVLSAGVAASVLGSELHRTVRLLAISPGLLAVALIAAAPPLLMNQLTSSNEVATADAISRYLDGRHLPDGSVLVDTFDGFPIVLESQDPRQFVITNDRDFALALTDPAGNDVQYLLVPAPGHAGDLTSLDALNRAYPSLYRSGAGFGTLAREFQGSEGSPSWRLYQVNPS